jgi:beta-ribofuranosylaminobenzene 5'-phosphate synthase
MKVKVTTSARLHLGFMDLNGDLGRLYGSIGVTVKAPMTQLTIQDHEELVIGEMDDQLKKRISSFLKAFSTHFKTTPRGIIQLEKYIPEHKGLGSGSQLGLALATALTKICNITENNHALARIAGRGLRSGIGITAFEKGGFIIDAGKKMDDGKRSCDEPPRAVMRYNFPSSWHFVLVIPEKKIGLSGEQEKEAMGYVSPSRKISEEICRLVMMQMLPALVEEDIEKFGDAVSEIDIRTGTFFKPVQGGIYSEKSSYGIIRHMIDSGAAGAGQSSWGPAVYGLAHENEVKLLAAKMKDFLERKNIAGDVIITKARNRGARIEIIP